MYKAAAILLAFLAIANAGFYEELTAKQVPEIMKRKPKWVAGYNQALAGKSAEELRRLNGAKIDKQRNVTMVSPQISPSGVPASFDARTNWPQCPQISHIRDQGSCGSCWAVSSTAVMGDRTCIQTNGAQQYSLSAENVLSCCGFCGNCDGGYPLDSFQYWYQTGVVTGGDYNSGEGCQPYEIYPTGLSGAPQAKPESTPQCYTSCENGYPTSYNNDKHYGYSYYQIGNGVAGMQQELLTNGPITTVFRVYADFYNYQSGIYECTSNQYDGNHVVKIIGWGEDNGTPYWLVANSWGDTWGMGGFFKIIRGYDECGFEEYVYAGQPRT